MGNDLQSDGRWACTRYTRDGVHCPNRTDNADRWCRASTCPGYQRATTAAAPERAYGYVGTATHVRDTGRVEVDLDVDEAETVHVTQRALDSFRYHHGGSEDSARVQLIALLEDLLLKSARRAEPSGYFSLARGGYSVTLSPDRRSIVAYRTAHRERTWAQVRAGVRSRFGEGDYDDYPGRLEPTGPALAASDLPGADPAQVRLTRRAMKDWVRHCQLTVTGPGAVAAAEGALRDEIVALLSAPVLLPDHPTRVHLLWHRRLVWLLSDDGTVLLGLRPHRPTDPPMPSS